MFRHWFYDQKMTNFFMGYLTYFIWTTNEGVAIVFLLKHVERIAGAEKKNELFLFFFINLKKWRFVCYV